MNLKDELGEPNIRREDFFSIYARVVKERFAPRHVAFHGADALQIQTMEGRVFTVNLENLWLQCRSSSEPSVVVFERHLSALASLVQSRRAPLGGKENVVPTIKDDRYLRSLGASPSIVCEHLAGDIWIVYALDLPEATQVLSTSRLLELGLSLSELRSLAIENLLRVLPHIEQCGTGPSYVLTGGDYSASILLLDDVWARLEGSVEGDIVAAVPSRGIVLFTGSNSADGIRAVRQKAREIYEGGDHVVSVTLLQRVSGRWKVFD